MFKWTPTADNFLAERAAQIGTALGVSKNAIIGRARRTGVRLTPKAQQTPQSRLPGVAILDLTPEMCRFPLGDPRAFERFRYCGAPAPSGRVYCDEHHARCHRAEYRQEKRDIALLAKALAR